MAQDIVPIELGLPQGDLVTLWAPRWREDGEDWEAFLGYEEALYAFPDASRLAAFVRTAREHDLDDHPAWHVVPALSAVELNPDEDHQFDLVGVPELVADTPDTWTINELHDIVEIARSLADVCELDAVHEVLDAAEGFDLLDQGTLVFTGKDGQKRWAQVCKVVAERWDEVLDALDGVVTTPEVPADAVATAEAELAEALDSDDDNEEPATGEESDVDTVEDAEPTFWNEIGIDPIRIVTSAGEFYSLRCYLDDDPVFLGSDGRIDVFSSPRALARHLAEGEALADNDLAQVATWPQVTQRANAGELEVEVDPDNTYVLTGLDADLAAGPSEVEPNQLDLAEELLLDAAAWAGDKTVDEALQPSERLGWLVSFVLRPSPNRLPPSPPFDAEVAAWRELVAQFEDQRLRKH
ncbi:MAG: primosomal protein [Saccharopolyspora sp.]|uniref:primosomal protein n=1 Tax=Saccharopolyspora TaxID=1835 RepID=UPI00190DAD20|nr:MULTISPECIES: primosomal protein [unclassified Saccharopolyspora]MBK0865969.1 primosomal protein [Saccharopolyspora sp. HNM0986]MBQ6644836.1 primosomal protein [Saccharopolyspora sp.]